MISAELTLSTLPSLERPLIGIGSWGSGDEHLGVPVMSSPPIRGRSKRRSHRRIIRAAALPSASAEADGLSATQPSANDTGTQPET